MEILVVWLLFAIVVGYGATTKGRSGLGWFLLSVLLSPLIAGILLLIMGQSSGKVTTGMVPHAAAPDHVATLSQLAELRDRGVLSEDEYAAKKADVLARV